MATAIGLKGADAQTVKLMKAVYRCMRDKDALQAEINPGHRRKRCRQTDGVDAKFSFDDNVYRQKAITEMRDLAEEDPKEVEASGHGLNHIALDGNIGCIVNGAGLAMASLMPSHCTADARQLSRCRRRRLPRKSQRLPYRAGRSERQVHPG